jgi:hypothetical protein
VTHSARGAGDAGCRLAFVARIDGGGAWWRLCMHGKARGASCAFGVGQIIVSSPQPSLIMTLPPLEWMVRLEPPVVFITE